ncbi:MAG TPA: 50S ribosomal protein L21 [Patescibacteria group bacterium]|nr:50S ribosomal protein L21 [Patescibacteria group bacterium]
MYAVIRLGGKQYKVSEGDVLEVQRLNSKESKVVFEDVLLLSSDGDVKVGKPSISGAKVSAKILENKKGDKVRVAKFKSKVRFRRVTGFRPQLTVVQIEKISVK